MALREKKTADTVFYKRKPLSQCSAEELLKAAVHLAWRIPLAEKERVNRSSFAQEFATVLSPESGRKVIEATDWFQLEVDKLIEAKTILEAEIEKRKDSANGIKADNSR